MARTGSADQHSDDYILRLPGLEVRVNEKLASKAIYSSWTWRDSWDIPTQLCSPAGLGG